MPLTGLLSDPGRPLERLADFDEPWCWKLINSPLVKEIPFFSRVITPNSTEHSLINQTLATDDTIRACLSLQLDNEDKHRTETLLLVSLGSGMDGHVGLAHGGTVSLLFDETVGQPILTTVKRRKYVTAELKVTYKKSLRTPGIVLFRSWADKIDGRKFWAKGTMEDGHGVVLATCEALYIDVGPRI